MHFSFPPNNKPKFHIFFVVVVVFPQVWSCEAFFFLSFLIKESVERICLDKNIKPQMSGCEKMLLGQEAQNYFSTVL